VGKLTPLLLGVTDLPADLSDLKPLLQYPISISNHDYAQGRPEQAQIEGRLNKDGRGCGVRWNWTKQQTYTPGLQTIASVVLDVSQYQGADGAKDGVTLIFEHVQDTPGGGDILSYRATQISGVAPVGEQMQAWRVDATSRVAIQSGTQTSGTAEQIDYELAWNRGTCEGSVVIVGINKEPSLDDFNRIAALQDARFKSAGC